MIEALLFDVFGTVVDWRTSLIRRFERFGRENGVPADWAALADDWRGEYDPAMKAVRDGQRPWTSLEHLHRESLDKLLPRHSLNGLSEAQRQEFVLGWHFLDAWPDTVGGLKRVKKKIHHRHALQRRRALADGYGQVRRIALGRHLFFGQFPLLQACRRSLSGCGPASGHGSPERYAGGCPQLRSGGRARARLQDCFRGPRRRIWPAPVA